MDAQGSLDGRPCVGETHLFDDLDGSAEVAEVAGIVGRAGAVGGAGVDEVAGIVGEMSLGRTGAGGVAACSGRSEREAVCHTFAERMDFDRQHVHAAVGAGVVDYHGAVLTPLVGDPPRPHWHRLAESPHPGGHVGARLDDAVQYAVGPAPNVRRAINGDRGCQQGASGAALPGDVRQHRRGGEAVGRPCRRDAALDGRGPPVGLVDVGRVHGGALIEEMRGVTHQHLQHETAVGLLVGDLRLDLVLVLVVVEGEVGAEIVVVPRTRLLGRDAAPCPPTLRPSHHRTPSAGA